MLIFLFVLKLFSLLSLWFALRSISIYSIFCISFCISFQSDFHKANTEILEKTTWPECWPRLGLVGVPGGSQTAIMIVFCRFGQWIVVGTGMLHPDSVKRGLAVPELEVPLAHISFWDHLSCRETPHPRLYFPRSPNPMTDYGWEVMVHSSLHNADNSENHSNSPTAFGVSWGHWSLLRKQ